MRKRIAAAVQVALLSVLVPVAAGISARQAEAARPEGIVKEFCAACTSSIGQIGEGKWGASWANSGACVGGSACAVCDPGCSVSETVVGTYAQVSAWYAWNQCENWGCWEMLPLPMSEIQTASVSDLQHLIADFGRTVKFNSGRSSIQLYDCKGQIALNLPLPAGVARQLAAQLEADASPSAFTILSGE